MRIPGHIYKTKAPESYMCVYIYIVFFVAYPFRKGKLCRKGVHVYLARTSGPFFMTFNCILQLVQALLNASAGGGQQGPRAGSPALPNRHPRAPKLGPRAPSSTPSEPKLAPEASKLAPRAPKLTPSALKWAPSASKLARSASKIAPRASKLASS